MSGPDEPARQGWTLKTHTEGRLAGFASLGRLWGVVKYFHPFVVARSIDWDAALLGAIPRMGEARTPEQRKAVLGQLLGGLEDPVTRCVEAGFSPVAGATPTAPPPNTPHLRELPGGVRALVAGDLRNTGRLDAGAGLSQLVADLSGASGVVLDLRGASFALLAPSTRTLAYPVLRGQLVMPGARSRLSAGYPGIFPHPAAYNSGFYVMDGTAIECPGGELSDAPLVTITDAASALLPLAIGLQAAGRAKLVFVGNRDDVCPWGEVLEISDEIRVFMRTHELVSPDGSVGVNPDLLLPAAPPVTYDVYEDDAVRGALGILGIHPAHAEPQGPRVSIAPGVAPPEKTYAEVAPLSPVHRLLGLFRLWATIEYFFPYKDLMDRDWDDVVIEAIPGVLAAADDRDFTFVIARVVAQLQDTHALITAPALDEFVGTHFPGITVSTVEGAAVVTSVLTDVERVAVGDVIRGVDGVPIDRRRSDLRPLFSASRREAENWLLDRLLLAGAPESVASLQIDSNAANHTVEVRVRRAHRALPPAHSALPVHTVLPSGFGYIDLTRLAVPEVDAAFETVLGAPGLIFDMRGYPRSTMGAIAARLAGRAVMGAQARILQPRSPSPTSSTVITERQVVPGPGTPRDRYDKPVVVLINASTISEAEHTCLFIDRACEATFIGTATNGADGSVTTLPLPGQISVNFSGAEIRHADGRQLQRVGVQPDVEVRPTLEAFRAGQDEVLEAAVAWLQRR